MNWEMYKEIKYMTKKTPQKTIKLLVVMPVV